MADQSVYLTLSYELRTAMKNGYVSLSAFLLLSMHVRNRLIDNKGVIKQLNLRLF